MLGVFSLLPLLKGWEWGQSYQSITKTAAIGQTPEETILEGMGWLMTCWFASNDCYARVSIETRSGKATALEKLWDARPYDFYVVGAFAQDPAGWLQQYVRPSRTSSAGAYVTVGFTGGYQGASLPYLDRTIIKTSLDTESTQENATIAVYFQTIEIKDVYQFVRSLRAVLGERNTLIPKELLEFGRTFQG